MLVELKPTSIEHEYELDFTNGTKTRIIAYKGVKPVERIVSNKVDGKTRMKTIIKLKEAGFTANEIIDLDEAGLIWDMGA